MGRSITIKDIARKLQISTSTVSRALRNQPDVNPETKEKVKELAKKLSYEPNSIALSLVSRKSYTLGVIVPSFHAYFYGEAISGIEEYALEHDYHIMICNTRESYDLERLLVKNMVNKRVDGLLISISRETKNFDHLQWVKDKKIPIVLFNRVTDCLEAPQVCVDDFNAAKSAVDHLIMKGYRKIAHIKGPDGLLLSERRQKGYSHVLSSRGLESREEWIVASDFSLRSGILAAEKLMSAKDKPDAIFCVCDEVAYGAMHWLKQNGYSVPTHVGVIGFTGEAFAELVEPPLTTVVQPAYDLGVQSARMIIERIQNPALPTVNVTLQATLQERKST